MKGNQMKMREALRSIQSVAKAMNGYVAHSEFDDKNIKQYASLIKDYVRYALSEPPRNCDVGTAEEQDERFHEFCSNHWGSNDRSGNNCRMCPLSPFNCRFDWAQMPYEQEGGER